MDRLFLCDSLETINLLLRFIFFFYTFLLSYDFSPTRLIYFHIWSFRKDSFIYFLSLDFFPRMIHLFPHVIFCTRSIYFHMWFLFSFSFFFLLLNKWVIYFHIWFFWKDSFTYLFHMWSLPMIDLVSNVILFTVHIYFQLWVIYFILFSMCF